MDLGLQGKVAWVLGASSGIGLAAARSLATEGAAVALSARGEDRLAKATAETIGATGATCIAVPVDVSDLSSIAAGADRIVHELGPVDILVANGGGPPPGPFESIDDDALHDAFELTTASAWRLAGAVTPSMKARGSGCLIFVTSWSTKEVIEGLLLSNMLRAAVVGLSKTLSKELGPHGIRTICVAPGKIDTSRLRELDQSIAQRQGMTLEEAQMAGMRTIPLGRYGQPSDVGEAIAFLASERASFISGITVLVDGGMLNGILS